MFTTWFSLYRKKSKEGEFFYKWKNCTDDMWYFSGTINEQNASTSLLLRFGMLMEACVTLSSTLIVIFYQMHFLDELVNTWINIHISSTIWISQMKLKKRALNAEFPVHISRNIRLISIKLNTHFVPQLKIQI